MIMEVTKLKQFWYKRLKETGFKDIEDSKGRLKSPNRRTMNFDSRDALLEFFLSLDHFLTHNDIPKVHRQILEMYSNGNQLKDIVTKVTYGKTYVKSVIKQYRVMIFERSLNIDC